MSSRRRQVRELERLVAGGVGLVLANAYDRTEPMNAAEEEWLDDVRAVMPEMTWAVETLTGLSQAHRTIDP